MAGPYLEDLGNQLYVVVFPTADDLTAEKCEVLVPQLEAASRVGPVAILCEVPPLRVVDPSMITFGLTMMSGGRINAPIIGVVAKSAVIRIALRAIQAALKVYGKDLEVATHDTRELGVKWATERLAALPK